MSTDDARRSAVNAAVEAAGLDLWEIWLAYFAVGGSLDQPEVGRYLRGDRDLDDDEYDMLAAGINDQYLLLGKDQPLPYSHEP